MKKALSLSVVIPVFNEQRYIGACLEALAKLKTPVDQIIIVDNNSTDETLEIVKKYTNLPILLLHEKRQSQVYAQKTGFLQATGDIVARLDADAFVPVDWTDKILAYFEQHPEVVAITGEAHAYDVPLGRAGTWIFNLYHHHLSKIAAGHVMLWGANCAFRAEAGKQIYDELLQRPDVWEDYDLSFCLAPYGRIDFVKDIVVANSFRAAHKQPFTQLKYQLRSIRTFGLRAPLWRTIVFSLFWSTVILVYPIPLLDTFLNWILKTDKKPIKP